LAGLELLLVVMNQVLRDTQAGRANVMSSPARPKQIGAAYTIVAAERWVFMITRIVAGGRRVVKAPIK